jgi:hypothetical protein
MVCVRERERGTQRDLMRGSLDCARGCLVKCRLLPLPPLAGCLPQWRAVCEKQLGRPLTREATERRGAAPHAQPQQAQEDAPV